ncbi:PHP domain-containing protein [Candidatus Daviesbacteria bacterium]|nr:PHP domain-containing protein [Candidatus Daviesbacteria bacterium]
MTDSKFQSLHAHTLMSDGKLTHQEVLEIAEKYGIGVVAFTDHDALPDLETLERLKTLNHPTKWLVGIEISASLPGISSGSTDSDLHVLGLFVDPNNLALLQHCRKAQSERIKRMEIIVRGLQNLGFSITASECLKIAQGSSVGQPHIVEALKSKQKNLKLIEEYREKLADFAKKSSKINQKYQAMVQQGERQYPYALFLSGDSPFNVKAPYSYFLSLDQAVSMIRGAGGIASLAHYSTSKQKLTPQALEEIFKKNQLDGAETVYRLFGSDDKLEAEVEKDRRLVRELLEKYQKVETGGADGHQEGDYQDFISHKSLAQQTTGMVEKILEKHQVLLEWTNL